jgi:2,3-bisphosphoglycerate-dependent phosphoglycerate mutase
MTKIIVIRHGNTFGPNDVPRRVGCRTDIPLVESGHTQGAAMRNYLDGNNLLPDSVFASALKRAQETASYLSDDTQTDTRFNEIDHGPDENKTEAEILERLGKKALDDWNDFGVVPDGWDVTPRAIQQSWINFADECVKNREGETTAIISSGGIIRFAPILLNNGLPDGQGAKVKTGSISLFEYSDGQWSCQFWNKRP